MQLKICIFYKTNIFNADNALFRYDLIYLVIIFLSLFNDSVVHASLKWQKESKRKNSCLPVFLQEWFLAHQVSESLRQAS